MKVNQLIKELSMYDPDKPVCAIVSTSTRTGRSVSTSAAMFESACAYPATWHPGLSGPERIIQRKG